MSKPINSQPIQKSNVINSATIPQTNIQNPPLQIQPKPVITVQSRIIQPQQTFAIQPNNQYLTNIQPNYSHANNNNSNNRTQQYSMSTNNSFTFTLAPIQAKPIESPTSNVSMIPSNFPPIQMRPNTNTPKQQPVSMPTTSANMTSAAAGGYYRDWILEAIDKLRERKARPDAERISTLMKRYHNIPLEDTVMCLNKLADTGSVVCVDYKGNISYRNPYKWRKNSANGGGIMNPPSITNRILEAFRHLDKTRNTDQTAVFKNGYSIAEVEQALTATQAVSSVELTKTQLRHCLEREAAYGKLMRRSDCTYVIDENGEKKMRKAAAIQAKKSALSHKPIANKTIAAAPHPLTNTTTPSMLTTLQSNINNSFTTFSVQPIQSFAPQITQFVTPNERQILPLLTTTSTPYTAVTLAPSPILPKQTHQQPMSILKCEATSPMNYATVPLSTQNQQSIIIDDELQDNKISLSSMVQHSSIVVTSATSTISTTSGFDSRATKTSRRGRPPGSKNKRHQDSENISTQQNKKQKIDAENNVNNTSSGSSCSALSISNSDQTVPATGSIIELCSECKEPQTDFDKFLCCKDCLFKVHPACLHYWPELTERARQSQWQCSLCKTCSICNDRGSKESVYICDGCDKGFHPNCHEPKIEEPVSSNEAWICVNCHSEGFRIKTEETTTNPVESVTAKCNGDRIENKNFVDKTNVKVKNSPTDDSRRNQANDCKKTSRCEDVAKWSVDEVCDWLTEEGFSLQSNSFRDQEIDGACLLLMKRIDVLTELNIKLGPAVKIYEKIKRIQNDGSVWRCDDCF